MESCDECGCRLIHHACERGHVEIVKLLLDKVDLESVEYNGRRPIHYACIHGNVEIVKMLLDKVNLETADNIYWKPIHYSCLEGHVEIVKILLDRVNIEAKDGRNFRPIHFACFGNHLEVVKLLVDGFISDKIYATLPKVKLGCKTYSGGTELELIKDENIKKYILAKIEISNRTIFIKPNKNYYDIKLFIKN